MRIKCPECHSVLEVKQPRPGRYQPVCTDCGKSFRFQITDGNPGKVRIGRMDPVATAKAEPATVAATNSMTQEVDEGIRTFESSFASDEIPERLGGYRILRLLGRGAMGSVYEAKQLSLDRLVALKTIRQRLAGNAASLARFSARHMRQPSLLTTTLCRSMTLGKTMDTTIFRWNGFVAGR